MLEKFKKRYGIEAQARVIKTGKNVWLDIERCLHEDDALTPSIVGILSVAKNPMKIPTEKQSSVLVKLLDKYADRL